MLGRVSARDNLPPVCRARLGVGPGQPAAGWSDGLSAAADISGS